MFRIARQDFAMEATRVRGIMPVHEVVALENPHPWVCGFAAMLGRDFPVVDLRGKLGIAHGSHGRFPCVIVVETMSSRGARFLGFIADRVSDVLTLRERDFRKGMVRTTGRSRRILDPDQILTEEELQSLWQLIP